MFDQANVGNEFPRAVNSLPPNAYAFRVHQQQPTDKPFNLVDSLMSQLRNMCFKATEKAQRLDAMFLTNFGDQWFLILGVVAFLFGFLLFPNQVSILLRVAATVFVCHACHYVLADSTELQRAAGSTRALVVVLYICLVFFLLFSLL